MNVSPVSKIVEGDLVRSLLALGAFDEGDHPVEERLAGARGDAQTITSDSTLVPPVTAERSPPDSWITGADLPVIADSSTLATPSTTSPSPGISSPGADHAVVAHGTGAGGTSLMAPSGPAPGGRLGPCLAQRLGLGFPSALGDGLGEVGEQDGEPEPRRLLEAREPVLVAAGSPTSRR